MVVVLVVVYAAQAKPSFFFRFANFWNSIHLGTRAMNSISPDPREVFVFFLMQPLPLRVGLQPSRLQGVWQQINYETKGQGRAEVLDMAVTHED